MDLINNILSEPVTEALGWTVLHACWQGLLAAGLFALLMWRGRNRTAVWKYRAGWLNLLGLLAASVATFLLIYDIPAATNGEEITRLITTAYLPGLENDIAFSQPSGMERYLPVVVAFWVSGVVLLLVRLLGGWLWLQRLRRVQTFPVANEWLDRMNDLAGRLHIRRRVQLLESALVSVPLALGHLKPIILFPVGAVNQLTPEEVEAVLAHELAHITRNDYLVNLLQSLLEVIYYFHPGVWWISSRMRRERENCCDDLAVAITGDKFTYARALVRLADQRRINSRLALAFSGRKNELVERVRRILNQPGKSSTVMEKITVIMLLAGAAALLAFTPQTSPDFVGTNVDVEVEVFSTEADTLKPGVRQTIVREDDNGKVELRMEDDEVTELLIDGQSVDPTSKPELVEELKGDLPPLAADREPLRWVGPGNEENVFFFETDREFPSGKEFYFVSPGDGEEIRFGFDEANHRIWTTKPGEGFVFAMPETGLQFEVLDPSGLRFERVNPFDFQYQVFPGDMGLHGYWDSIPDRDRERMQREMEEVQRDMERMQAEMMRDQEERLREMEAEIREMLAATDREAAALHREAERLAAEERREAGEMDEEEYRALVEEHRAEVEQLRQNAEQHRREAAEEARRERERFAEERALMEEEMARVREDARREQEEIHRARRDFYMTDERFMGRIEEELRRDGLWSEDGYEFDLNAKRLKVNGKKQSKELHGKYLYIYRQVHGKDLCEDCSMVINSKK